MTYSVISPETRAFVEARAEADRAEIERELAAQGLRVMKRSEMELEARAEQARNSRAALALAWGTIL